MVKKKEKKFFFGVQTHSMQINIEEKDFYINIE